MSGLVPPPPPPPHGRAPRALSRGQPPPPPRPLRVPPAPPPRRACSAPKLSRRLRASATLLRPPAPACSAAPLAQQGLLGVFLFDLGLQILAWIPASLLRTEAFYDLFGSLTFLASSTGTLWLGGAAAAAPRARAATALLCCWAARLGAHLVTRIARDGRDKRFDRVRDKPSAFLLFWLVQGVWVFVTSLPVLLLNTQPSAAALRPTDVAGALLWLFGFALESVADWQKAVWRAAPGNQGRWIDVGLWRWSRHPNYAGEIALWSGMAVAAAGALASPAAAAAALASPLFVAFLLTRVSGVPLLERAAEKRWGGEKAYREYVARTRVLF